MTSRIFILTFVLGAAGLTAAEGTNDVANTATNAITTVVTNAVTNAVEQASAPVEAAKDVTSFEEFKIITQRNIFDPNRRIPGRPGRTEDKPKPTRIDYLNLVGAMSYEKGRFAFFDGSSSEYRKSVKPGDSIAGYKIAEVTQNKVTLQSGDKKIELPVGGQLKREDEGEWRVNNSLESFASSHGSTSSPGSSSTSSSTTGNKPSSSDEPSDALKRLLERRRNEK